MDFKLVRVVPFFWILAFFVLIPSETAAQVKIMPLGDSITRGVSGPSTDEAGYRNDLRDLLVNEGGDFDLVGTLSDGVGFDADHEGHDGWRADRLLQNLDGFLNTNPPDVVLLHIGTNDISNEEAPQQVRDDIAQLLDTISAFDPDIRILIASLIPRTDDKDDTTTDLNGLLLELYQSQRDQGLKIFYAGMNEMFKINPNWQTDYFQDPDKIHPTDDGFNLMAQVWFNTLMTAINAGSQIEVTDNFERTSLGVTWDADPEYEIQSGDLVNTATQGSGRFEYMATFKAIKTPTRVALKWSDSADRRGISRGGLALLLDSPTKDASGFLAYITAGNNMLRLWTITNGVADEELDQVESQTGKPDPGESFEVILTGDSQNLQFDYFVDGRFAGSLVTDNPGVGGELYSGVLLQHNRKNDIASFLAEGSGDFEPPAPVTDLAIVTHTATSALLVWTATGDDNTSGTANRYDLRYSNTAIQNEDDFNAATPVPGLPAPLSTGETESYPELDLLPGTEYFFALKVIDEANNPSPLSNVVNVTTDAGQLILDDFNRANLGADWTADDSVNITDNEMANAALDQNEWDLAIFQTQSNADEVSFRWSREADTVGVDQSGIAVMLDDATLDANGYLITRRTLKNEIRLWKIIAGQSPVQPIIETPMLVKPKPGDELRVRIASDQSGNHFTVFVNGIQDITISDPDFFIDPSSISNLYCGLMLAGGRNNNVDNFKILRTENTTSIADDRGSVLPQGFALSQNYPNPFNPSTNIEYRVAKAGQIKIAVFNTLGQRIRTLIDEPREPGTYSVVWDATSDSGVPVASGVYLIRMQADDFFVARQAVLLR